MADLKYALDDRPGFRRRLHGKTWVFLDVAGRPIRDADVIARIRSIGIPPAWTDVWICPQSDGHLQATGRDAKGRKQYRYHPAFRALRDDGKYAHLVAFAKALPRIRQRVRADLRRRELNRDKVLAAVVVLLERSCIRIGNEEYRKQNGSYGLTTLRHEHVRVAGAKLRFSFRGKSGKMHSIAVESPRVARIVRRCQELPGQELFHYVADDGTVQPITSFDVNAYLREISGQPDISAKSFRTWAGTVHAAQVLGAGEQSLKAAIALVASRLGNTVAVCRKSYIHPAVIAAYERGERFAVPSGIGRAPGRLRPEESAVLRHLERWQRREAEPLARTLKRSLAQRSSKR